MKKRMAKSSARSKRREGSQKSTTSTGKTAPPSQELKELAETLKSLSTSSGSTDSIPESIPEHDTQNAETKLYLEQCQARNLEFCETWANGEVAGVDIIKPLSYFLIQALNTLTIEGLFSDKKTTATIG